MSKKYSASKFRLSLASNSPRPTELPLENGPLCLRFASRHIQGTGGTLAREASCGKNRSRNASHHSFAIFPSIFLSSASHTSLGLLFPRVLGVFEEKCACSGPGVGPGAQKGRTSPSVTALGAMHPDGSQISSPWTLALLNYPDDIEPPPQVRSPLNLVTDGRWLCITQPRPWHGDKPEALPWKVLNHPIPRSPGPVLLSPLLKIIY